MYGHFRNELIHQLAKNHSMSQIRDMMKHLDVVSKQYEFTNKNNYNNEQLLQFYLNSLKYRGLKDSTIYKKEMVIKAYIKTIDVSLNEIRYDHVRIYLFDLFEKGMINKNGARNRQGIIWCFFEWLWVEKYTDYNLKQDKDYIRTPIFVKVHLTTDELNYLKESCDYLRDQVIIEFVYSTGCKHWHIQTTKIEYIDFKEKQVQLYDLDGNFERVAYLTDEAIVLIQDYLKSRNDENPYLFVSLKPPYDALSNRYITELITRAAKKAGFDFNVTIRILNYTTIILAFEQGMQPYQIKQLMGYKKLSSILSILKYSYQEVKEAYDEVKEYE